MLAQVSLLNFPALFMSVVCFMSSELDIFFGLPQTISIGNAKCHDDLFGRTIAYYDYDDSTRHGIVY